MTSAAAVELTDEEYIAQAEELAGPLTGVIEALTDEEAYLYAVLTDRSGLDLAEFAIHDPEMDDGCFRAWPFQVPWWRDEHPLQIDQCVAEGQLVLTSRGHVPIESVVVGDEVLTHLGRWRLVTDTWDRGVRPIVSVRGQGSLGLRVTPDHQIWARRSRRASKPRDGHTGKKLLPPEWITPNGWEWNDNSGVLHANWGTPARFDIPWLPEQMVPAYASGRQNCVTNVFTPEWMWLYGLYVAEGSSYVDAPGKGLVHRVTWSVHQDEVDTVASVMDRVGLNYSLEPIGIATNIRVNSKPVTVWLKEHAGTLAHNKRLGPWVLGLPEPLRRAVFDGATFGDGWIRESGRSCYSTASGSLALEMRLLGLSLGKGASVGRNPAGTSTIRGRTVARRERFLVDCQDLHGQAKPRIQMLDGAAWGPVTSVVPAGTARVFDLAVAEDNSFVVEGVAVHNCGRSVGKSLSIKLRGFAFPFNFPGQEMVVTAPELIHLEPITNLIESQFYATRLGKELLPKGRGAVTHRPFMMNFANGARIIGRIPQRDGKGMKGVHPIVLEQDESQDYPKAGWKEVTHTLKRGVPGAQWRAHGVSRGVQDEFFKKTQESPANPWKVHRISQIHRPSWGDDERAQQIAEAGGSREDPDYKRNVYGSHGAAVNLLFVLHRLMKCVDIEVESQYNEVEYHHVTIRDTDLEERQVDVTELLDLPARHTAAYKTFWIGMDVGYTSDPSEILVFAEYLPNAAERRLDESMKRASPVDGRTRVKLLARISLIRMSNPDQVAVILAVVDHYKPKVFALDKTGVGLPLFQDVQALISTAETPEQEAAARQVAETIKGYNFSEKILVEIDETVEIESKQPGGVEPADPTQVAREAGIERSVLEWSTDCLRKVVDEGRILLPWDLDLVSEFQGQTFSYGKSPMDSYGRRRRIFSEGKFHALDAARMAIMGLVQHSIEEFMGKKKEQPVVLDSFVDPY